MAQGWRENGKGAIVRGKDETQMIPLNANEWGFISLFDCFLSNVDGEGV